MIKLVNGSLVCHLITSAVIYFEKKEIPVWKWSLSMEPSGGLFGLIHVKFTKCIINNFSICTPLNMYVCEILCILMRNYRVYFTWRMISKLLPDIWFIHYPKVYEPIPKQFQLLLIQKPSQRNLWCHRSKITRNHFLERQGFWFCLVCYVISQKPLFWWPWYISGETILCMVLLELLLRHLRTGMVGGAEGGEERRCLRLCRNSSSDREGIKELLFD